jgi:hypothetical protein
MARPCTDRPKTAVVHPSPGIGDGMSDGGRTSQVAGCSPAGLHANWPTTGGAVAAVVGLIVEVVGAVVVDEVVVDEVEVDDVDVVVVDVEVDGAVVVVGGEMLDVGTGAAVSSVDSLAGADDSVRVVHPAASTSVSTTDVTIEVR